MHNWIGLAAALGAALIGLIGVRIGVKAQRQLDEANREHHARLTETVAQNDRELELVRHELQQRLEVVRRDHDTDRSAQQLAARYQEPLVRAAFDLQSRLWNILEDGLIATFGVYGTDREKEYVRLSTQWLFAQYFGWVEILRRETQFLPDRGHADQSVDQLLARVAHVLSSDAAFPEPVFRIFRSEQRAVGELMITKGRDAAGQERTDCMGYAEFVRRQHENTELARWLAPLAEDVERLVDPSTSIRRLVALQNALIDVVDHIDRDGRRFPPDQRGKCTLALSG